jgi:AbrB family looped-hinge helix DNA binding protein
MSAKDEERKTMAVVTTSSRGQIVIPKEIRKRLGILPGKKLLTKAEGERSVITPLPDDRRLRGGPIPHEGLAE